MLNEFGKPIHLTDYFNGFGVIWFLPVLIKFQTLEISDTTMGLFHFG